MGRGDLRLTSLRRKTTLFLEKERRGGYHKPDREMTPGKDPDRKLLLGRILYRVTGARADYKEIFL